MMPAEKYPDEMQTISQPSCLESRERRICTKRTSTSVKNGKFRNGKIKFAGVQFVFIHYLYSQNIYLRTHQCDVYRLLILYTNTVNVIIKFLQKFCDFLVGQRSDIIAERMITIELQSTLFKNKLTHLTREILFRLFIKILFFRLARLTSYSIMSGREGTV